VPCGKLDGDEHPAEAVIRELLEETGLSGEIVRSADSRTFQSRWNGHWTMNLQWNYLVQPKVDPAKTDTDDMPLVRLPKEDQAAKWVPTDEIDTIAGMDEHNLATIRQGLAALELSQGRSTARISSSWRR
jgi:8-oxo-dGTP pyrophosphatase MutT (NUDIX family)